jgi:hypothetical protein
LNGTFDQSFFLGGMVTRLSGGTITSAQPLNFQQGTLAGSGIINANVSLSDHMTLAFQLGGTSAGSSMDSYDQLNVNGAFTLAGTLALAFKSSFESLITNSDKFVLLTSTSGLTGSFTNIASGSRLDTTDGYGSFIVNYNTPHLTLTDFVPNTRWLGGSGNWTDAARWSSNPDYPHNSDSTQYSAAIHSGSVNLDTDITVSRCLMTGGSLTGGHVLTLTEGLVWTFGTIAGSAGSAINLTPNSTSTIALEDFASGQLLSGRTINNAGVVNHSGSIDVGADSSINNLAGATWNMQRDASMGFNFNGHLTFNNFGNVVLLGGNESSVVQVLAVFNNNGSVELQNGVELKLSGGGTASGAFTLGSLSEILFAQGSPNNPYTFTSGAVIKGTGNVYIDSLALVNVAGNTVVATSLQNGGKLTVASGATLTVTSFEQSGFFTPTTQLNGGTITSVQPLDFQVGMLTGSGIINGNISNNATISPGSAAGSITVNGNFSLLNNSKLVMEIGGLTQGTQYDYLAISGLVGLDGTLELHMLNGFQLQLEPDQIFTLLTSSSLTGAFDNIANGARLTTSDGLASFQVNYGPGSPYGANNLVLSDPRVVPEPASLVLFAGGAMIVGLFRYRRR